MQRVNSSVVRRLAGYLSATQARSGTAIGIELGCSRKSVRTYVESLRNLGIEVDEITGQGYILKEPLELLDEDSILAGIDPAIRRQLNGLEIRASVDSTNSVLQRMPTEQQHLTAIFAEHQSLGRGRRGRQWHSPYGRNLYLSLGWKFDQSLSELGCLPLVVALATAQALGRCGLEGQRVKWPNDLLLDGRKLCGCLVEMQGDTQGPCFAVIGVGINVHMPVSESTAGIDQPWTDLHSHREGISRNALAAWLLEELVLQLESYTRFGFAPFIEQWQQWDGLYGQAIRVFSADQPVDGTAMGIDAGGALLLDTGKKILKLYSGDVSLSPVKI